MYGNYLKRLHGGRLSLRIENGLPRKTCVHLAWLQVHAALQLSLWLYVVFYLYPLRYTSILISFSPKVTPAVKIYRFCYDCNEISVMIMGTLYQKRIRNYFFFVILEEAIMPSIVRELLAINWIYKLVSSFILQLLLLFSKYENYSKCNKWEHIYVLLLLVKLFSVRFCSLSFENFWNI